MRNANNLRELRMNINNWAHIRMENLEKTAIEKTVKNMMLRPGSVLRVVGMGSIVYRVRSVVCAPCPTLWLTGTSRGNGHVGRRKTGQIPWNLRLRPMWCRIDGTRFLAQRACLILTLRMLAG